MQNNELLRVDAEES